MDKELSYIKAAIAAFMRYGVRRATMADIATAAGVSRQTLYATFSNKDQVLEAVIDWDCRATIDRITTAWAQSPVLSDQIDAFFLFSTTEVYEKLQAIPDSHEMLLGVSEIGRDAVQRATNEKRALLATLFEQYRANLIAAGTTPEDFSDFVTSTLVGYKQTARSKAHLLGLMSTLKLLILTSVTKEP